MCRIGFEQLYGYEISQAFSDANNGVKKKYALLINVYYIILWMR